MSKLIVKYITAKQKARVSHHKLVACENFKKSDLILHCPLGRTAICKLLCHIYKEKVVIV